MQQQTPASKAEPVAAPTLVPASEEVPPPLPASPPPTEVEAAPISEPEKVSEVIAQVESLPAEPKDTIDIPGIAVQPASPIPTPKVEEDVVAKIEQPVAPAPIEEPKTGDIAVPEAVEAQVPTLVEEKTVAPIEAIESVPLVPHVEEHVALPTETPAQVIDPKPIFLRYAKVFVEWNSYFLLKLMGILYIIPAISIASGFHFMICCVP